MRYTKKFAKEILDLWKNETNYFNGSISAAEFENMLRYRMGFGQAETWICLSRLDEFLRMWLKNIKEQGFDPKQAN